MTPWTYLFRRRPYESIKERDVAERLACIAAAASFPTRAAVSPAPTAGQYVTAAPTVAEEITVASAAPTAAYTPAHGTPGICTFVDTVVGTEKEEGQDRLSVQVNQLWP